MKVNQAKYSKAFKDSYKKLKLQLLAKFLFENDLDFSSCKCCGNSTIIFNDLFLDEDERYYEEFYIEDFLPKGEKWKKNKMNNTLLPIHLKE